MTAAAPKGEWQQPHPDLVECPLHYGLCAYRAGDPARCDFCHVSWITIATKWKEDTARHTAAHATVVARRANDPRKTNRRDTTE